MSITKLNNLSVSALTALPSGLGGKVLQVITATDSTQRNTTSLTFVTASNTLSVSITPASASNKIFITTSVPVYGRGHFTIYRDSTNLGNTNGFAINDDEQPNQIEMSVLDSPSTTSATTYGVQVSSISIGTFINRTEADTNSNDTFRGVSYITVMEIAAWQIFQNLYLLYTQLLNGL